MSYLSLSFFFFFSFLSFVHISVFMSFCLYVFLSLFCRFFFLSFQVRCDTEIAFCPWSAQPLSYLGLTGKEASLGYCQTDKLGTQYFDDKHLNRSPCKTEVFPIGHKKSQLFLILNTCSIIVQALFCLVFIWQRLVVEMQRTSIALMDQRSD